MAILLIGLLLIVQSDKKSAFASRQTNLPSSGLENQLERNNHCIKYHYQIQDTLASTVPPLDNYFNISSAIYPTGELPSKLIKSGCILQTLLRILPKYPYGSLFGAAHVCM